MQDMGVACVFLHVYFKISEKKIIDPDRISEEISFKWFSFSKG
jgi:hypothetical protein